LSPASDLEALGAYTAALDDSVERAANELGGLSKVGGRFDDVHDIVRRYGSPSDRETVLGEVPLSAALAHVERYHHIESDKHRALAVRHFIELMGDLDIMELRRKDVLDFIKAYRSERRGKATLTAGTIRRRLGALTAIVNHYYRDHDIHRNNPFKGSIGEAGPGHSADDRHPLDDEQIEALCNYLKTNMALRDHTRAVFWLIVTTGAGPAEAAGIAPEDLFLEHEVPYVWIQQNERRDLKTNSRKRRLPLVGQALHLASHLVSTTSKAGSVSPTLNKHLKKAVQLRDGQSAYSLRHSMADRLRRTAAPRDLAEYILGHARKTSHDRYGSSHPDLDVVEAVISKALPEAS
ncbi:MAG: tyrosine-type recombinase/integrase, partial [Pseudomonadota bacterium]